MARRLTPDEHELWRLVTANVRPFRRSAHAKPGSKVSPKITLKSDSSTPEHKSPLSPPDKSASKLAPRQPTHRPNALDTRALRDLRRERLTIDARIDLHGLRAAEAHRALNEFLRRAHQTGARVVLVVTGKGLSGSGEPFAERGILRRHTPHWLSDGALSGIVAGFAPASQNHGGDGALYVRLRAKTRRPS